MKLNLVYFFIFLFYSANLLAQRFDSINQLKEIRISAVKQAEAPNISTLKPKDIEKFNIAQDIPYILQSIPSLNMSSDAGNGIGYTNLWLRGADNTRIQLTINGFPFNDAESHLAYFVNIQDIMSSASEIQVVRGLGHSVLGGAHLGGLIHIQTNKITENPFNRLNISFGSFNTLKTQLMGTTGLDDAGIQVDYRLSYLQSDGYIDRGFGKLASAYLSILKQSKKTLNIFNLQHGYEKTYQSWYGVSELDLKENRTKNIAGTDFEQKIGLPYDNQTDNYNQTHIQILNQFVLNDKLKININGNYTKGRGFYEEYKVAQNLQNYKIPKDTVYDLIRQLWLDNDFFSANASLEYKHHPFIQKFVASYSFYQGTHFGKLREIIGNSNIYPNNFYHNQSYKQDVALFHQLSWKTSKISAMLDFQFRHVFYRGLGDFWERDLSAFQSNFNFFNPKFSMHFQLNPIHSLYLFGGLGHKEPNRNDILDNVNKPVKSEQLYNLELAYQLTKKNISFKTNFFGMYFIDQLVLTGRINEIGAYIRENVPQSYRFGLELAYEQKISPKWSLNSNFTAMRSIIPTYYHYIYAYNEAFQIQHEFTKIDTLKYTTQSFSPKTIAFADLNFTPHPNSKLSLQGKLTSAQFLDNTQNEKAKIPSFFVLNANYKQDFPMNKNKCSIQFQLNNILNSSYVSSGYTYGSGNSVVSNILLPTNTPINYYFPQAGLNVLISLQYQW